MLFPVMRGVCVLAALATVGLWVRSHYVTDGFLWSVAPNPKLGQLVHARTLFTAPGRLIFQERSPFM